MRARLWIVAFALWAGGAAAQSAMTGPEFEAYVTGKTLLFAAGGAPYGGEDYLPGRRVRWSFLDGICEAGRWYDEERAGGAAICFVYDSGIGPVCWQFFEEASGLRAVTLDDPPPFTLIEIGETAPLTCLGPEVGV